MPKMLQQYAALPLRLVDGNLQVLLVTSRVTKRWIIPKGHPEKKMEPSAVAALEAQEEAGVTGIIGDAPVGSYLSTKRVPSGKVVPARVSVFRLDVDEQLSTWKEKGERKRRWVSLDQAVAMVEDGGLAGFLAGLSPLIRQAA